MQIPFLNAYSNKNNNSVTPPVTKKGKKRLNHAIATEQLDRARADIKGWRTALDLWEDIHNPDRAELARIYQEVENDDQVTTKRETITNKLQAAEFEIVNQAGEIDETKAELFDFPWFDVFIEMFVNAELKGFELIQFGNIKEGQYIAEQVEAVPTENLYPEKNAVRKRIYDNHDLLYFDRPPFAGGVIGIGRPKAKGLYNNIAPLYIYKKNALGYWGNYQSKFGIPPVVAKTDLSNGANVKSLVNFLSQMASNSFLVADLDDEVSTMQGVNVDAHQTFLNLIKYCDEGISKVMEGQTMTSDNGSSKAQGEVHERTAGDYHLGRLKRLRRVINQKLIPKMIADGFPLAPGDVFRFKEIKDLDKIIERAAKLSQAGYKVEKQYLIDTLGMPLEEAETAPEPPKEPQSVVNQVDKIYNEFLND